MVFGVNFCEGKPPSTPHIVERNMVSKLKRQMCIDNPRSKYMRVYNGNEGMYFSVLFYGR